MKAVLQYRASPGFIAELERRAAADGFDWASVDETDEAGFAREIADAQVLLHVLKPVTAAMMDQAPGLKLIQKLGVGVNTIDLEAARARGIAVSNMPGTNSQAVAEMTLALLFAVLRRINYFDALTRAGEGWRPDLAVIDATGEIAGRTVGFLGYGGVPARLAPVFKALGAEVIYTARAPKPDAQGRAVSLDELITTSDILSLHAPLTDVTRGIIGAEALGRMKPGAILINTARGELVDQAALHRALASGRLGGAGLDVFAREPVDPADPLFALPNVVVAPHMAWLTPETLSRSLDAAFENCRRLRDGRPLKNQVV
ncbi:2-hydroxyacid dehydrogenase [Phenylobacterium sp. VNQ135]|uniref:2-hydroxyacid dehydrogenase n=1 Tax=Phenylobacterium sp. VNQ135 TaxID=3400922 RepID=UPI003BFBAB55